MPKQVRSQRAASSKGTDEGSLQEASPTVPSETTELTDELLDEIDALLEENAADFVANYVQKGGQ